MCNAYQEPAKRSKQSRGAGPEKFPLSRQQAEKHSGQQYNSLVRAVVDLVEAFVTWYPDTPVSAELQVLHLLESS